MLDMERSTIFDSQMTVYDMHALEELCATIKPHFSMEIGSWKGQSASIIARYTDILYCVDTWQGAANEPGMVVQAQEVDIYDIFKHNLRVQGLWQKIRPLQMTSVEAQKLFINNYLNFIYIDGSHAYEDVIKDLHWGVYLAEKGILVGHDYDDAHPGVKKAVQEKFGDQFTVINKSSIWFVQKG